MLKVLAGLVAGLVAGYALWGYGLADPPYLKNLKRSDGAYGPAYVLLKDGLYPGVDQVAIIHGLLDDQHGCETMAEGMRDDGGEWSCLPADLVPTAN